MTAMSEVERWSAVTACRDTVARAARLADLQDHEALAALFTEDAELQRPGGEWMRGRAAILEAYRSRPSRKLTRHLIAGTVVDLLTGDKARAVSTVLLLSGRHDDPVGPFGRSAHGPLVVGEFDDMLSRDSGGAWRIARRCASFTLHTGQTP